MTNVNNNSDRIRHLERNMTNEKVKVKQLNSNLTNLVTEMEAMKTAIQNNHDGMTDHNKQMEVLKENITVEFGIVRTIGFNITDLQTQIRTMDTAVQDNYANTIGNSNRINRLNETVTASLGKTQNLGSNITYLEREIRTAQATIQDNYDGINAAIVDLEALNMTTLDNILKLDNKLSDITAQLETPSYAFSAYWLADRFLDSGDIPIFSKTIFDEDHVYDNTSGKYTVKRNGIYQFTARFCLGEGRFIEAYLVADGERIGGFSAGDNDYYACSSATYIRYLKKGTTVWILVVTAATCCNDEMFPKGFNYFAGHLIN